LPTSVRALALSGLVTGFSMSANVGYGTSCREFGAIQLAMRRAARNAPTVLRHRARPGLIFPQPWQRIARALHTRAHFLP